MEGLCSSNDGDKKLFNVILASARVCLAQLFQVRGLLNSDKSEVVVEISVAYCEQFVNHIAGKSNCTQVDLDYGLQNMGVWDSPSGPLLWDMFPLVSPKDVASILGEVRPTACRLDPFLSWLLKEARSWLLD